MLTSSWSISASPVMTMRFSILVSDTPPFTIYRRHTKKKREENIPVIIPYCHKALISTALKQIYFCDWVTISSIIGAKKILSFFSYTVNHIPATAKLVNEKAIENSFCYWSPSLNRSRYADNLEFQLLPPYKSSNQEIPLVFHLVSTMGHFSVSEETYAIK